MLRVNVGEYLKFGCYPQNDENQKEPIEWLVLEIKENKALLISCYGLDYKQYHHENAGITWEECNIRKWLNNDFFKMAFLDEEQQRIIVSVLSNDDNPKYRTMGGIRTEDRVFCLSIQEVEQYFTRNRERKCKPTSFAHNNGVYANDRNGCCYWWLRSPGRNQNSGACVHVDGSISLRGRNVTCNGRAVRPVLWVKL